MRAALACDRYSPQERADMARRLDECIEVSALCMDLALAGERHRLASGSKGESLPLLEQGEASGNAAPDDAD